MFNGAQRRVERMAKAAGIVPGDSSIIEYSHDGGKTTSSIEGPYNKSIDRIHTFAGDRGVWNDSISRIRKA